MYDLLLLLSLDTICKNHCLIVFLSFYFNKRNAPLSGFPFVFYNPSVQYSKHSNIENVVQVVLFVQTKVLFPTADIQASALNNSVNIPAIQTSPNKNLSWKYKRYSRLDLFCCALSGDATGAPGTHAKTHAIFRKHLWRSWQKSKLFMSHQNVWRHRWSRLRRHAGHVTLETLTNTFHIISYHYRRTNLTIYTKNW